MDTCKSRALQRTNAIKRDRTNVPQIIRRSASFPSLSLEPDIKEEPKLSPLATAFYTKSTLDLVELDPVYYKIEATLPDITVISPSTQSSESSPEKKCQPHQLRKYFSAPSASAAYLVPLRKDCSIPDDELEVSSVGGYLSDEETQENNLSDVEESSIRLHSQDMLNELLVKFKIHSHSKGTAKSRQRAATEASFMRNAKALDMIQLRHVSASSNDELSGTDEDILKPTMSSVNKEDEEIQVRKRKKKNVPSNVRKSRTQSVLEERHTDLPPMSHRQDTYNLETLQYPSKKIEKKTPNSPKLNRQEPQKPKKYKLHNPRNAEKLLKHLQSSKYDQVERDEQNNTPLHSIIHSNRKDKIECLVTLMVHSDYGTENIDMPSLYGTTALHLAVQKADVEIVKLLLVFGANIDALNDKNQTPLDLLLHKGNDPKFLKIITLLKNLDAKHGKEVIVIDPNIHRLTTKLLSISSQMPELQERLDRRATHLIEKPQSLSNEIISPSVIAQQLETNLNDLYTDYNAIENIDIQLAIGLQQFELQGWKVTSSSAMKFQVQGGSRILFLDGGGIRGLIQIEIMTLIEQRTGHKITDLFDWIIGTSTGGIVALGLVYGKKSLAELRQFYFKMKEDIFAKSGFGFAYNTEALENILKEIFGTKTVMSDIREPKVLISAVYKKTTNLQLHFFNNCFFDEFSHQPVWKVARYTSAAPMYFSECDDYVDGGVLANNPSDYGLTAIQNFHRHKGCKLDIACVVSIGTGTFPAETLGSTDFAIKAAKKRATNLLTLLTKALVESEDVARNCTSRCQEQHIPFFRFCPHLATEIQPGETDTNQLIDMLMTTKYQAAEDWSDQLDELIHIFLRIEEYSRKETIQKLREKRRKNTYAQPINQE